MQQTLQISQGPTRNRNFTQKFIFLDIWSYVRGIRNSLNITSTDVYRWVFTIFSCFSLFFLKYPLITLNVFATDLFWVWNL